MLLLLEKSIKFGESVEDGGIIELGDGIEVINMSQGVELNFSR